MPLPGFVAPALGKTVKLGRIKPTAEMTARVLPLKRYLHKGAAASAPAVWSYKGGAESLLSRMYANDELGCCVISAHGHDFGTKSAADKLPTPLQAEDGEIRRVYRSACGSGDNGCYMISVLDWLMRNGITMGGAVQKIDGFVSIDPRDPELMNYAGHHFGGLLVGFNCPAEYVSTARPGFVWKHSATATVGGHAVPFFGRTAQGYEVSTWGVTGVWEHAAMQADGLIDECYAIIAPAWFGADRTDPHGLDLKRLLADLAEVAAGRVPPEPDPDPDPPDPFPPAPGPVSLRGRIDGTLGTWFGTLPINLQIELSPALLGARNVDYWSLLREVVTLAKAVATRDWEGAIAAVLRIVALLGIGHSPELETRVRAAVMSIPAALPVCDGTGTDSFG